MKNKFFFLSSIVFGLCFLLVGCNQETLDKDNDFVKENKTDTSKEERIIETEKEGYVYHIGFLPKTELRYYKQIYDTNTGEILDNVDGVPLSFYYKAEGGKLTLYDHYDDASFNYYETDEGLFEISPWFDEPPLLLPYPIELGKEWHVKGTWNEMDLKIVSINESLEINGQLYNNLVKVQTTIKGEEDSDVFVIYGKGLGELQSKNLNGELTTVTKIEEK